MNPTNIERTRNAYLAAWGMDGAAGSINVIGVGSSDVRGEFVMNAEMESNVRSLPKERITALSQQNGWSLAFAEGYVDGEIARRRGSPLSCYLRVGIDQYALGYRASYFERPISQREADQPNGQFDSRENEGTV